MLDTQITVFIENPSCKHKSFFDISLNASSVPILKNASDTLKTRGVRHKPEDMRPMICTRRKHLVGALAGIGALYGVWSILF